MKKTNQLIFEEYGKFYDLFYKDKDYSKETNYILDHLIKLDPDVKNVLELGSGSGNFSEHLTASGLRVSGIERSESMLSKSIEKSIENFTPYLGDIIDFDLKIKFDAVVSLFDVISYLTNEEEIISCFKAVNKHLKDGGYFIFDSWHTAGVYASLPTISIKRVDNDAIDVTRIGEPSIDYELNTVGVKYEFIVHDKKTHLQNKISETHTLRHFSISEINFFAHLSGFRLIKAEEPITGLMPTNTSWKVCYILQKHE